ncbi:MAG: UvrD/REP helicase [Magnetococcales bacterium]|nr:UvrD/REP helicase [Magnetococcales bacterium]HIJ83161.1 UvrD-helicase domain-containing protein [Magnetococcales bacterium]
MILSDHRARETALDIHRSFIVQAPAGSGKTGLLTQRVLALLAQVGQPEEIVAITFTRKAAAEMKDRVLKSLTMEGREPPKSEFDQKTWHLAQAVLERDRQRQWRLLENPNRLHIMTIDALCHAIVRQLPILTELGGKAALADHAELFYRQAARETLDVFDADCPWKWAVEDLFRHLDNDWARIESMLAELLARRDQWLRHVSQGADESLLERLNTSLAVMIRMELSTIAAMIPDALWPEIVAIMAFAKSRLLADNNTLSAWIERVDPPGVEVVDVILWHELADTLLTREGTWRKRLDVRVGFPPKTREKDRALAVLERMADVDGLAAALGGVRQLPADFYSQQQWQILKSLLTLLKVAAGHLMVQFAAREGVDHMEVARRAIMALGAADNPSDLALRLDHRIRHILVDEFQDTSRLQYELLERMIAGWDPSEGNTLFLVGDPMQSIYRFREADVGLFLKVQSEGIGPVKVIPLHLEVNFRSVPGIVDWVNASMKIVFPRVQRPETGAVEFKRSQPFLPAGTGDAVVLRGCRDRDDEARQVVDWARMARSRGQSVCILARNRGHLSRILPELDAKGLHYQAVELHPLARVPVIQDLLALTRALIHPGDRVAWLAVLRAPWCGLSLADLHVIANWDPKATLWDCLQQSQRVNDLISPVGRDILARVCPILEAARTQRGHWSAFPGPGALRRWVEGTWRMLGAPATLSRERYLSDAKSFFDLLESLENNGAPLDTQTLEDQVSTLFANIDPQADPKLVVMTIHKAKGLEFDCVIVPGLDRQPRPDDKRLLLWMDPPVLDGEDISAAPLVPLLAPIGGGDGADGDSIYRFVWRMEKEKSKNEVCRLLYVAVTRAKQNLYLSGLAQEEESQPAVASFMGVLWPFVEKNFAMGHAEGQGGMAESEALPILFHYRLHRDWHLPSPLPWMDDTPVNSRVVLGEPIVFDWVGRESRLLGIVIHRFLAIMAKEGMEHWSPRRIGQYREVFKNHLLVLGMSQDRLEEALQHVSRGLTTVLGSAKGRWLLDRHHRDAHSEWRVTGRVNNRLVSVSIDRSFVDQDGVRWIIDFKTSQHEGGDKEGFLANEKIRYQAQLDLYARLIDAMEDRPIRLGLFFPLMDSWLEWPWLG